MNYANGRVAIAPFFLVKHLIGAPMVVGRQRIGRTRLMRMQAESVHTWIEGLNFYRHKGLIGARGVYDARLGT